MQQPPFSGAVFFTLTSYFTILYVHQETGTLCATSIKCTSIWKRVEHRPSFSNPDVGNQVMEQIRQSEINEQEPVGIIISRGPRAEEPPRFSAYIWGPVPGFEYPVEDGKPVAA